ncbi:alpha/beta hydrolase [Sinomonas cellulolyticus]|jgi:pimeloyl-ACP methyl ester carboxylesterase|uniref:Alpha/beta hydrolase n=1 Tax=Sinomonas cellulolyticus TaxID=2801916 RepID=A0ABS1JYW8_9MICC|nr:MULTISPECIES: alpha/beta hydrolase [Sinomonas]MBL0704569.1 alpha/beta hydrolase [Sinomonas cellulolyticus]GHG49400.1 alpha/beta hydrolase [Sinomonas sp. KCTC 49339]
MERLTSADGTTIAYDRLGSGPAVILVSGASVDRRGDAHLAQALAEDFTVYNYDRRGRGDSTDTLPFAVEREIEDIAALLDAAGAATSHDGGAAAAVVGFSSGAALAARAAAVLPVRALVMWEPPFMTDEAGVARAKQYTENLNATLGDGDNDGALTTFLRYVGLPDAAIDGSRKEPFWEAAVRLAPTLAYDNAAMGEDAVVPAEDFGRITAPTLVLAGGASPDFLPAAAEAVAAAIPGARTGLLDGQTHNVDAAVFAQAVREFLPNA